MLPAVLLGTYSSHEGLQTVFLELSTLIETSRLHDTTVIVAAPDYCAAWQHKHTPTTLSCAAWKRGRAAAPLEPGTFKAHHFWTWYTCKQPILANILPAKTWQELGDILKSISASPAEPGEELATEGLQKDYMGWRSPLLSS